MSAIVGYLLYLSLRVSGTILVPIVVHAMADFSVFSEYSTQHPVVNGTSSPAQALTQIGLLVVVLIAHKRISVPADEADDDAPEPATIR